MLGYLDDALEYYAHRDSAVLQFSKDGALVTALSLGAPANHVRLAAHDGVVDVAFDAELTRQGDRAVYWRRITDGSFVDEPVRLSAPALSQDPDIEVGVWDVFFGVDPSGVGRVLYRRVTFWGTSGELADEPPELFWHTVSPDGAASPPASLGVFDNELLKAAFAPDGSACVVRMPSDGTDFVRGTSYLPPLLLTPLGTQVELAAAVLPDLVSPITTGTGEKIAVAADARSVFRPAAFLTKAYRGRIDPDVEPRVPLPRVPRSVFVGTLPSDGTVMPMVMLGRGAVRIPHTEVTEHHVAADGTTAIAGFSRRSVAVSVVSPEGGLRGHVRFPLTPGRGVLDYAPVLASSQDAGRTRWAVAWSTYHEVFREHPRSPSKLRVAFVE